MLLPVDCTFLYLVRLYFVRSCSNAVTNWRYMGSASRIRHSFVGRWVRETIHALYSLKHRDGRPVQYRLAAGVDIQLYPEGEIAEFLSVQRFFEKTEMALT